MSSSVLFGETRLRSKQKKYIRVTHRRKMRYRTWERGVRGGQHGGGQQKEFEERGAVMSGTLGRAIF